MNNFKINPSAMEELKDIFSSFPESFRKLKTRLKEKEETIVDYAQMHGDHLHGAILPKGQGYFYGIWTQDEKGNQNNLVRISKYINE